MPNRPPVRCTKCRRLHTGTGQCENCRKPRKQFYNSRAWKDLRARVLTEEPVCRRDGCIKRSVDANHIIPIEERWDLRLVRSNIEGLCRSHHSITTAQERGWNPRSS